MTAYIDYSNLCSYLASMSKQDFKQCNDVLLNSFDLCFSFNIKEMAKAKKEIKRNFDLWVKTATKNRNKHTTDWDHPYTFSIEEDKVSFDDKRALYMVSKSEISGIEKTSNLIVASDGEELETIKEFQIEGQFMPTKLFFISSMENWDIIGRNSTPATDIIIVDSYLFAQNEVDYEVNAFSLIDQLCSKMGGKDINLIIFSRSQYYDKPTDTSYKIPFMSVGKKINEYLTTHSGINAHITFIELTGNEKHDRSIVTNYRLITSGDSFKYFKDGKNVSLCSHGDWMTVSSLHDTDNFTNSEKFIQSLQTIVNDANRRLTGIIGEKKSNFLHFS